MPSIVAFHVLMLLLALGVISKVVSPQLVSDALGYLHTTIGITTPPFEKARMIALVWIGATVVIVDGCLVLLVFLTKLLN